MPNHSQQYEDYFSRGAAIATALNTMVDGSCNDYYDTYDNGYNEMQEAWRYKSVKSWTGNDILHWISHIAREISVCPTDIMGEKFASLDGYQLSCLTMSDFQWKDRSYGSLLYERLQHLLEREGRPSMHMYRPAIKVEEFLPEEPILTRLEVTTAPMRPQPSPSPPPSPYSPLPTPPPGKKGRGRPRLPRRKKKTEKLGRLWEFLRDLLKNPEYCPSLIQWDNHDEGMFRFVHSDKVAKLWGSKKENPDMNYEKLSRAMRYYYKSQVLMPVYGRRLVYKFGPNAKHWRVENPNFQIK